MKIKTYTKRYIKCPKCYKEEFEIEQLFEMNRVDFGPWFCNSCNISFHGNIEGGEVDIRFSDRIRVPVKILLQLEPQKESIFFMLDSYIYPDKDESSEDIKSHLQFYYEEHTCMINWLDNVCEVKIGEDTDPHGLATFEGYRIVNKANQIIDESEELL